MGTSHSSHRLDRPLHTSLDRRDDSASDDAQRYRHLLAAIPDLMFRMRRDGTYIDFHAPDEALLWHEPKDFLGKRIEDVFDQDYANLCKGFIEATLKDGKTRTFEYRGWGEHSDEHWEVRLTPCGCDEVLALAREITARKKAEEELLRREQYLRTLFETAVDPLWDWDVANDRAVFSSSWATMIGFSAEEYDPQIHTWDSVLHPDDAPLVDAALQRHLRGETEQYEAEYRLRHRDGTWKWAYSRGKVIERNAEGKALRMIGAIRDITSRKQAEEEARRSEERQRVLLRELDHRVRNNLASLVALIDISCQGAKDVRELAASIRSRVQAMSTAHMLLTRSHMAPLDLRSLITALVPAETLPCIDLAGPDIFVSARQSTALGMVMQEILTNSMKYGSLGTLGGRVQVTWRLTGENASCGPIELELTWTESGGPPIPENMTPGVGTTLINGLVRAELRGRAELAYPHAGAAHRLLLRLDRPDGETSEMNSCR